MTTTATTRPKLRPGVSVGPPAQRGPAVVHHIKDEQVGTYYRIGPKEHFLLSRMDGTRTVEELGEEYAEEFGRRLGETHWASLFSMLVQRQLLDGAVDPERLAELAQAADDSRDPNRSIMRRRFPLVDPGRLLGAAAHPLRFLFHPAFVVPAFLAIVVLEVFVFSNFGSLLDEWRSTPNRGWLIPIVFVIMWSIIALHELAHGLTCTHYGGRVKEIGILWRFPILAPYCKVDDVVMFPARRHKVFTAFAGIFTSLVMILPVYPVWAWSEPGTGLRGVTSALLLYGSIAALINLVPFLQLDGYYMLTHSLGMVDLRRETYYFWKRMLGKLIGRPDIDLTGYPRSHRVAYTVYGLANILFLGGVVGGIVGIWFVTLRIYVGSIWAAAILILEAVVLFALARWYLARQAARAEA